MYGFIKVKMVEGVNGISEEKTEGGKEEKQKAQYQKGLCELMASSDLCPKVPPSRMTRSDMCLQSLSTVVDLGFTSC